MSNKEKSILQVSHDMACGLYEANIIDAQTMREFDTDCLPEVKLLTPRQIKRIRLHEKVSQAVFAKILNISVSTVRQWEQGEKCPRGLSLKVLNVIGEKGLAVLAS